jgi:hypothetical protein
LLNPTHTKTQKPTEPSKCHSQKWLNQFDDLLMTPDRLIPVYISFNAQSLPACTKRAAVNGLQANTIQMLVFTQAQKTMFRPLFSVGKNAVKYDSKTIRFFKYHENIL